MSDFLNDKIQSCFSVIFTKVRIHLIGNFCCICNECVYSERNGLFLPNITLML